MHAPDWIALAVALAGGGGIGGGGIAVVTRMTRLAVAVEGLVDAVKATVEDIRDLGGTTAAHATQLALHDARLGLHDAQLATAARQP